MEIFYYKQFDENGDVVSLITYNVTRPNITDPLIAEITQEEYGVLLAEIVARFEAASPVSEDATEEDYLEALSELGVAVE